MTLMNHLLGDAASAAATADTAAATTTIMNNTGGQVYVLATITAILAVSLYMVGYYFLSRRELRDAVRFPLVLYLLGLVITVFTSFVALTTGVTNTAQHFWGAWGGVSISFIGPPAIWMVTTYFLIRLSRHDQLFSSAEDVDSRIALAEQRLGWIGYEEWKTSLGESRRVIDADEMHVIEDLLPKVYYHGKHAISRPESPIIKTLFCYVDSLVIKFQRIQGRYSGHGPRPEVYLPSTRSTALGRLSSVHCVRGDSHILSAGPHNHGEWKVCECDSVDVLICTIYEGDLSDAGDYLYVDVAKYLHLGRGTGARVELSVLSNRRVRHFQIWELYSSMSVRREPVPLVFKALHDPSEGEAAVRSIVGGFGDWWPVLRETQWPVVAGPHHHEVEAFWQMIWKALGDDAADWQRVVNSSRFVDAVSFASRDQDNVLMATFNWNLAETRPSANASLESSVALPTSV